jgi:hypothetical protein
MPLLGVWGWENVARLVEMEEEIGYGKQVDRPVQCVPQKGCVTKLLQT